MTAEQKAHIVRKITGPKSIEDESAIAKPGIDMLKIHWCCSGGTQG